MLHITKRQQSSTVCFVTDFNVARKLHKYGYSRIPVYKGNRKNIVGLIVAKVPILVLFSKIIFA
jgi:CBS domain containing-hemolysin-like protein